MYKYITSSVAADIDALLLMYPSVLLQINVTALSFFIIYLVAFLLNTSILIVGSTVDALFYVCLFVNSVIYPALHGARPCSSNAAHVHIYQKMSIMIDIHSITLRVTIHVFI